jgi:hypothetical protein
MNPEMTYISICFIGIFRQAMSAASQRSLNSDGMKGLEILFSSVITAQALSAFS